VASLLRDAHRGEPGNVEGAIALATSGYQDQVSSRGFDLDENEQVALVVAEQGALIEGLIRLWHLRSTIIKDHEVLDVEKEDQLPLTPDITWQARADALLKNDGDLYVYSLKTAARWDIRQQSANEHDMQGLSEAAAIEARLGEKIFGVRMEYLLKGERRKDEGSGQYRQMSPLIRGYRRTAHGVTEDSWEYAHSYYYTCTEPHQAYRGQCPGEKRHSLGKGWESFNAWEEMGVKEWMEWLAAGIVQPLAGDVLDKQIVTPLPYYRDEAQMEDWREQVTEQETRIATFTDGIGTAVHRSFLNRFFPQHSNSCDYPVKCDYQDLCWGADYIRQNPLANGYVWREPHHEPELVQLREAA
jgi:hypothetical protein